MNKKEIRENLWWWNNDLIMKWSDCITLETILRQWSSGTPSAYPLGTCRFGPASCRTLCWVVVEPDPAACKNLLQKCLKMQERYNWRFKVSIPKDTLLQHSSYLQPSCNWPKHNRMKPSTSVGGLAGVRIFDGTHTVAAAGLSKSWGEDFPKWI